MKFSGPQLPAGWTRIVVLGAMACSSAFFFAMTAQGWAQNGGILQPVLAQPGGQISLAPTLGDRNRDIPSGSGNPLDDEKLLRALNADRQKALVSDTNKLIRLVDNLNAEIEGSAADSLTPDQLRKMAEIEKLARGVKEKMSQSVRGISAYHRPSVYVQ